MLKACFLGEIGALLSLRNSQFYFFIMASIMSLIWWRASFCVDPGFSFIHTVHLRSPCQCHKSFNFWPKVVWKQQQIKFIWVSFDVGDSVVPHNIACRLVIEGWSMNSHWIWTESEFPTGYVEEEECPMWIWVAMSNPYPNCRFT